MALTSPWSYTTTDTQGKTLSVTITFDTVLSTLLTVTGHKDAGCAYSKFYVGLGPGGIPDTATAQFTLADGDALVALLFLSGLGLNTINDVLASQVTAGP